MPINAPDKIIVPWATTGIRAGIPQTADTVNGRAGFDQGFPPINMTPKAAGGIPPFGQDFNGIFYDLTLALQFMQAGGSFPYDGEWAAEVDGYPVGALVSRTDNQGLWRNIVPNNTTDPEAGGEGWQPEGSGSSLIFMSSTNVTLTPLQASRGIIVIAGTLAANLQLIFPEYIKQWVVINTTTDGFSVNCKTASGSGVVVGSGRSMVVVGDGTSILAATTDLALGQGQAWANVTASRALNTNYTNTTGRAIAVACTVGALDGFTRVQAYVNEDLIISQSSGASVSGANEYSSALLIVPPGATYRFSNPPAGATPAGALTQWMELR